MDHRPFEDWLLTDETLNFQQKRELNAHLQTCRSCSAIAEVNLAFRSARLAEPAAGFADRFQVRLAAQRKAMRRRNVIGFAVLTLSVAGLLTGFAWPLLKAVFESPVHLVASWLSSLVNLWVSIQAIFQAGSVLFRVVPGFIPAYFWIILLFALTGGSVVWVVSLMKFTKVSQGVQR
jgi:hypothetical protein